MSLDDQLFKQDGTLLTRVDIAVLKFARFVANFFLEDDEESYSPTLIRVMNLGSITFGVAASMMIGAGDGNGVLQCLFNGWYYRFLGKQEIVKGCSGKGTNVDAFTKVLALCAITFVPSLITTSLVLWASVRSSFFFLGVAVFALAFFLTVLPTYYIVRLDQVPPRKKRVKETKLAIVPNIP